MKKIVLMAGAALVALGMASCGGNKTEGDKACNDKACEKGDVEAVFTGVLPAADCDGIRYTLTLEYDADDKDGDYKLIETYIQADTTETTGYKDLRSVASEGDFTVNKQGDKTYLKLVKDAKDSAPEASDNLYFVVDSETAITLTNSDLEVSTTPGMNYTLKKTN